MIGKRLENILPDYSFHDDAQDDINYTLFGIRPEIMLESGFVKAYDKIYCNELANYQALNLQAKSNAVGLYQEADIFKKCLPYVNPVIKKSLVNH